MPLGTGSAAWNVNSLPWPFGQTLVQVATVTLGQAIANYLQFFQMLLRDLQVGSGPFSNTPDDFIIAAAKKDRGRGSGDDWWHYLTILFEIASAQLDKMLTLLSGQEIVDRVNIDLLFYQPYQDQRRYAQVGNHINNNHH
jgi:hypothetical protein